MMVLGSNVMYNIIDDQNIIESVLGTTTKYVIFPHESITMSTWSHELDSDSVELNAVK